MLTTALREFEGSTLVISHDRLFLEELEPTHVLTVRGGTVLLEERGLRESDWADDLHARVEDKLAPTASVTTVTAVNTSGKKTPQLVDKMNVKIQAGPSSTKAARTNNNSASDSSSNNKSNESYRQISKLESSISKHEKEVKTLDEEMIEVS